MEKMEEARERVQGSVKGDWCVAGEEEPDQRSTEGCINVVTRCGSRERGWE